MGTAGFAAPEQFGFGESDIRTDIYGLGATVKYVMDEKPDLVISGINQGVNISCDI